MTKITTNMPISGLLLPKIIPPALASRDFMCEQVRQAKFVEAEGCCFLDYLYRAGSNVTASSFQDETGYECFINHFHIDDDPDMKLALSVCSEVGEKWLRSEYRHLPLRQIVSADGASSIYRCHIIRPGESWLAEDLSGYAETVVVVDIIGEHSPRF